MMWRMDDVPADEDGDAQEYSRQRVAREEIGEVEHGVC